MDLFPRMLLFDHVITLQTILSKQYIEQNVSQHRQQPAAMFLQMSDRCLNAFLNEPNEFSGRVGG